MGLSRSTAMLATAGAIGLGSPAGAQTIQGGWEFRVSNVVSPSQPTATVEVWAWFDNVPGVSELFIAGDFDLVASEGEWSWNFVNQLGNPIAGPVVRGSSIIGVAVFQLHIPSLGIYGDPSNPIHVFSAEWTTSNLNTPRTVGLRTESTYSFHVAAQTGHTTQLWPQGFVPGSGLITVIPSPASGGLAFVVALHCFARRRRERNV